MRFPGRLSGEFNPIASYTGQDTPTSMESQRKRKLKISTSDSSFGNSKRFHVFRAMSPGPGQYKTVDLSRASPRVTIPKTRSPRIDTNLGMRKGSSSAEILVERDF